MKQIPKPIFQDKLSKISWQKVYEREYGVQYSEMAIMCLTDKAKHHVPKTSVDQIVVPSKNNTAFYADAVSWLKLVESLNSKYTSDLKGLAKYEKQFVIDGANYLNLTKKLSKLNVKNLSNSEFKDLYIDYHNKLFIYTIFIWTAYLLNNYVADRATGILDKYIEKSGKESEKQDIYASLFSPPKKAAILQLQYEVEKAQGNLSGKNFEDLYERFKWLSCLDLHNLPWTKEEFKEHIKSFSKVSSKKVVEFSRLAEELKIKPNDLDYLLMAKSFVYIKDARDDYRRQGVFYALTFFKELANRMGIGAQDVSYLQEAEIIDFLDGKLEISKEIIAKRKKGFVMYLSLDNKLVCLQGDNAQDAMSLFKLSAEEEEITLITGMVASKGLASGNVVIVHGVKDLEKVKDGDILVAVATHPDYVPAMRRAIAIVTDEGGVTSHAAIVAREFGIPCIVGTKKATSLLKDGDIVEVNAQYGWIKKLN